MTKLWYAVMFDKKDTDWGMGTFDESKARTWLAKQTGEQYVAVISNEYDDAGNPVGDPICVGTIEREDTGC